MAQRVTITKNTHMNLQELFLRDIHRHINPAVTVDSFNTETISAEINEYIFTDKLIEDLYKFLNLLFNTQSGKTGVWINGYYGSGKSHFIKYAHYCMHNLHTMAAFDHYTEAIKNYDNDFTDATLSNIQRLRNKITNSKSETIIFNIEAVATDENSKRERLTEIFLKQLNRHRGYNAVNIPLALYLEKSLDKQNKFDLFKTKVLEKFKLRWNENANDLISLKLRAVLDLAKEVDNQIDTEALREKILNKTDFTIKDTLVPELKDYLADKPQDYRLIFMVDEISQFIGNDISLLLNLQTIVESIEEPTNRRVWLVATAQETLDNIVNIIKRDNTITDEEAVGKILGRFEHRISLESQKSDYITQKRILDKKPEVVPTLESFYHDNKEEINNKFIIQHSSYKAYQQQNDFVLAYPFIPYQFKLIADVFDAFSSAGYVIKEVKDNERSVLGITHKTIKAFTNKNIGDFVPFDAFFNDTFQANLTHKARRMLTPAKDTEFVLNDEFAERVVLALFMISNISSADRNRFSSNIDNLVILLYQNLKENKAQLQANIYKVLSQLLKENIIYEEDGNYFFYKEEEMDMATRIKNTTPSSDDRHTSLYDILKNILRNDSKVSYNNNTLSLKFWLDDKAITQRGDIDVKFLIYTHDPLNQLKLSNGEKNMLFVLNTWFSKDNELENDFLHYLKTAIYLGQNNKDGSSEHKKTFEKFSDRNKKLRESIEQRIKKQFHLTPLISGNQIIDPEEITGSTPEKQYKKALNLHFERIYKYSNLVANCAHNTQALKNNLQNTQQVIDNELTEAEQRIINAMQQNGNEIILFDLCSHFEQPPFGWKDIAVIDVVRSLAAKKTINISYRNQERMELTDFIEKAPKLQERKAIAIKPGDKISQEKINELIDATVRVFNRNMQNYTDAHNLVHFLKNQLIAPIVKQCDDFTDNYAKWPFAGTFKQVGKKFYALSEKRDILNFFDDFIQKQADLQTDYDKYNELKDFTEAHFKQYKEIADFIQLNRENCLYLSAETQEKSNWIIEFFETDAFPVDDFRKLKKNYTEVKTELENTLEKQRDTCIAEYITIAEKLKKQLAELDLPNELLSNCNSKIQQIKQLNSITAVQLEHKNAPDFETKYLTFLLNEKAQTEKQNIPDTPKKAVPYTENNLVQHIAENKKKTSVNYALRKSAKKQLINSKDDIEDYLNQLRTDLTKLLNEADTIILE